MGLRQGPKTRLLLFLVGEGGKGGRGGRGGKGGKGGEGGEGKQGRGGGGSLGVPWQFWEGNVWLEERGSCLERIPELQPVARVIGGNLQVGLNPLWLTAGNLHFFLKWQDEIVDFLLFKKVAPSPSRTTPGRTSVGFVWASLATYSRVPINVRCSACSAGFLGRSVTLLTSLRCRGLPNQLASFDKHH